MLGNEKYKGDALLQKYYTPDFLTKKQVRNGGEIPQYYVEGNHEAIIDPAMFDRVQDILRERSRKKGYSGVTIFSSKIQCGCCGAWYGSKVWHSTDKSRHKHGTGKALLLRRRDLFLSEGLEKAHCTCYN
jgi:hypothetical protein